MSDLSLRGFALRSMAAKKEVALRPATPWISYATHFANRTLICPGEGCVACRDKMPREFCAAWGLVDEQPGLMVLSQSTAVLAEKAISSRGYSGADGVVELLLRRTSTRRPWQVEGLREVPEELVRPPAGDIVRAVGRLMGVPRRFWSDDFAEMIDSSREWASEVVKREWSKIMLF